MNYETRITQEPVNCSDSELCTFLQALAEGFLPTFYSDTSQSAQSKSMSIASKSYQRGKKTVLFHGFQSLMMSRNLTDDHGADSLTLWPVDSRARILASLEKAQESTESKVGYGQKWRASLAKFDPDSRSWKTAQLSLIEDSDESSVTWPRSGMTADGHCWELQMLGHRTNVIGSGLWRTPSASVVDAKSSVVKLTGRTPKDPQVGLADQIMAAERHMWPTPTVCGNNNRKGVSATSGDGLATAVRKYPTQSATDGQRGGVMTANMTGKSLTQVVNSMERQTFATPIARDWKSGKSSQKTIDRNSRPLSEQIGGQMNPTWVEWLMGWPTGWTDLKPLETGKSHCAPQRHGACSQVEKVTV